MATLLRKFLHDVGKFVKSWQSNFFQMISNHLIISIVSIIVIMHVVWNLHNYVTNKNNLVSNYRRHKNHTTLKVMLLDYITKYNLYSFITQTPCIFPFHATTLSLNVIIIKMTRGSSKVWLKRRKVLILLCDNLTYM